ncbi:MAG: FecR domain-containing protein [Sedimentisphaerales bacterium]|nr:FecR domain-containing protein [Sedimentisphaerales bacterium]MBN2841617.1 FecR domain-containing protein [Sedimentisphaerales bacterium]
MSESDKNNKARNQINRFDMLLQVYLDGSISDQEGSELAGYLRQDGSYIRRFVLACKQEQLVYEIVSSVGGELSCSAVSEFAILHEFAEYEDNAPCVERKQAPVESRVAELPVRKVQPRQNKISILSLMATAALIFLVVYVRMNPLEPEIRAALLADEFRTVWSGQVKNLQKGNYIFQEETISLAQGIIKLQTDRDVTVIIEGPAEFSFRSNTELALNYGHIYSKVMKQGAGFTVKTPNAMIVDLGTEFSIKVGREEHTTEVQMYNGSAVISNSKDENSREIIKTGSARAIDSQGVMVDIPFDTSGVLDRTLSGYEKRLAELQVSTYCTFNDKVSWVNDYVSDNNLFRQGKYNNVQQVAWQDKGGSVVDSALYFGGGSEGGKGYVTFDQLAKIEKGSFTVAVWFRLDKADKVPAKQFIVANFDPRNEAGWRIGVLNNRPFVRLTDNSTGKQFQNWQTNINELGDGWHSLVMVVDREKNKLTSYLDGKDSGWKLADNKELAGEDYEYNGHPLFDNLPAYVSLISEKPLHLGVRYGEVIACPFRGWLYDMAIWGRALPDAQVRELYSRFPLN